MKAILHWINNTFVWLFVSVIGFLGSADGLINGETGIYTYKAASAIFGAGLNTFTFEKDPIRYCLLIVGYLVLGIVGATVFIIKARRKRRGKFTRLLQ